MTITPSEQIKTVSLDAFKARQAVCGSCESVAHDGEGMICSLCKCPILAKQIRFNQTCPAGKWPSLTELDRAGDGIEHLKGHINGTR